MRISTVLLSVLSASCSTLTYIEPSANDSARVRFATTSKAVTVLRQYDDNSCSSNEREMMRLADHYLFNSAPKSLGMPLARFSSNAAKEVYVSATQDLNAMFFGAESDGLTVYSCAVPISYRFSSGHDYEVAFRWAPKDCHVTVSEIVGSGESASLNEVAAFSNRVNDANTKCLEQFKKLRLY